MFFCFYQNSIPVCSTNIHNVSTYNRTQWNQSIREPLSVRNNIPLSEHQSDRSNIPLSEHQSDRSNIPLIEHQSDRNHPYRWEHHWLHCSCHRHANLPNWLHCGCWGSWAFRWCHRRYCHWLYCRGGCCWWVQYKHTQYVTCFLNNTSFCFSLIMMWLEVWHQSIRTCTVTVIVCGRSFSPRENRILQKNYKC